MNYVVITVPTWIWQELANARVQGKRLVMTLFDPDLRNAMVRHVILEENGK